MAGEPLIAEGVSVEVLGPSLAALERENEWMKELYREGHTELLPEVDRYMNSASLLLRFTCGGKTFLLRGIRRRIVIRTAWENPGGCFQSRASWTGKQPKPGGSAGGIAQGGSYLRIQ